MRRGITLLLIVAIAVLVRIGAALYLGGSIEALPGTADQVSYHNLALRLLGGFGYSFDKNWWPITPAGEPTAHWSYIYTLYLAGIYAITDSSAISARLIQAIIVGILQPLLAFYLTRRIFGQFAAVIAAAWMALYGYFIYYSATLMTEPFYITAILASVLTAVRLRDSISLQEKRSNILVYGVMLGLLLGLAVLLRQLFIILVPFLLLWIAYTSRPAKVRTVAAPILVSMAVIIAMILPFTIYNYSRFGHLVPLNSNAGYAFFLSNHPTFGNNFIAAGDFNNYQDLYPEELLDLDEAALDQALLGRGLQFVVEDPIRYVRLSLSRIPIYFNFWPLPGSDLISNVTKITSFGLMLPFFILGLFKWLRSNSPIRIRNLAQNPGSLLLLIAFVYSAIHILSWVQVRYRLPVDALFLPFAAAGLGFALEKVREQFRPSRAASTFAGVTKAPSTTADEY